MRRITIAIDPKPTAAAPSAARPRARFLTGSLTRHILIVAGTGAIGLMGVFLGEFASLLFLGWLGDVEVLAAAGYAAAILFFPTSVAIGLSIAATALVAPAVGAGDMARARRLATNAMVFAVVVGVVVGILLALAFWPILSAMGATGRTRDLAFGYLLILAPATPLMTLGMTCMAVMRCVGDATRAMNVPLFGAAAQFLIEPGLIFLAGLGMTGSALALFASRIVFAATGLYGVIRVHQMTEEPTLAHLRDDAVGLMRVGLPAIATNVATPIANLFTTGAIAAFGNAAVAAWAIAGRLTPLAFGIVFALPGAVGPVIGQNFGARDFARVREAFWASIRITAVLCAIASLSLILAEPYVIKIFGVSDRTAALVNFYCLFVAPTFFFLGLLFVTNAAFNVLGHAHVGTWLNWGRATLGTIPLVWLGGRWFGAEGALLGSGLGGIVFGLLSVWLAMRLLPQEAGPPAQ